MKKIFQIVMIFMISSNVFGQNSYSGTIGEYPVKFYINSDFPEHNSYYSYSKYNKTIGLIGGEIVVNGMCTGKLVFFEKDQNGKNKAQFTFEKYNIKKEKLSGIWTDLISKKSLKVALSRDYIEEIKKVSKKDSIIIKNHLRKLEAEILVDKHSTADSIPKSEYNMIVNKIISVDQEKYEDYAEYESVIKKILFENKVTDEEQYQEQIRDPRGLHWGNGNVYYSPDETFKVFVFEGEDCGAHCNAWYDSFVQLKSGKILSSDNDDDNDMGFTPIISLIKTGANTYAAIQINWSGGTTGRFYYDLYVFSLENDTLRYIPLKNDNLQDDSDGFGLSSHWSMNAYLEYNTIRKKFQFHYERFESELFGEHAFSSEKKMVKRIPKTLLPIKDDEILVVKGEFEIVNGKITNYKEWYEKKKESFDEN